MYQVHLRIVWSLGHLIAAAAACPWIDGFVLIEGWAAGESLVDFLCEYFSCGQTTYGVPIAKIVKRRRHMEIRADVERSGEHQACMFSCFRSPAHVF